MRPYVNTAPDFTIRHSEIMDTVIGATSSATAAAVNVYTRSFIINPSNTSVFPWLGQFASSWDMWNVLDLWVEYVPRAAATVEGTLTMAFDYDAADADTTDPRKMSEMKGATKGRVSDRLVIKLNRADTVMPVHKYFTGHTSGDSRLNNIAKLMVSASSSSAGILGELVVHYNIKLFNPQPLEGNSVTAAESMKNGGNATTTNPLGVDARKLLTKVVEAAESLPSSGDQKLDQVKNTVVAGLKLVNITSEFGVVSHTAVPSPHETASRALFLDFLSGENETLSQALDWTWVSPPTGPLDVDWTSLVEGNLVYWNMPEVQYVFVVLYLRGIWSPNIAGSPPSLGLRTGAANQVANFRCGYAPSDITYPTTGTSVDMIAVFQVNSSKVVGKGWFSPYFLNAGTWTEDPAANGYGTSGVRLMPYTNIDGLSPTF